jgi:hypothetical protein
MSTVTPEPQVLAPIASEPAATAPVVTEPRVLGILSVVLGAIALFTGHLFVFAIAALVLGIVSFRREPGRKTLSIWGISLGGAMIVLPILAIIAGVALLTPFAIGAIISGH